MTNKQDWLNYFELLQKIGKSLGELAEMETEKCKAVTKGEVPVVDDIMRKEQAYAMTLRGYEQKRIKLLAKLDVPPESLRLLEEHLPKEVESQGKRVIEFVSNRYAHYREVSDLSRQMLEANLKQMESLTGVPSDYKPRGSKKTASEVRGRTGIPGNLPPNIQQMADLERGQEKSTGHGLGVASELGLDRSRTSAYGGQKSGRNSSGAKRTEQENDAEEGGTSSRLSQFVRKKKEATVDEEDVTVGSVGSDSVLGNLRVNQGAGTGTTTGDISRAALTKTAAERGTVTGNGLTEKQKAFLEKAKAKARGESATSDSGLNAGQKAFLGQDKK